MYSIFDDLLNAVYQYIVISSLKAHSVKIQEDNCCIANDDGVKENMHKTAIAINLDFRRLDIVGNLGSC